VVFVGQPLSYCSLQRVAWRGWWAGLLTSFLFLQDFEIRAIS
jgi:hypothetical protein